MSLTMFILRNCSNKFKSSQHILIYFQHSLIITQCCSKRDHQQLPFLQSKPWPIDHLNTITQIPPSSEDVKHLNSHLYIVLPNKWSLTSIHNCCNRLIRLMRRCRRWLGHTKQVFWRPIAVILLNCGRKWRKLDSEHCIRLKMKRIIRIRLRVCLENWLYFDKNLWNCHKL